MGTKSYIPIKTRWFRILTFSLLGPPQSGRVCSSLDRFGYNLERLALIWTCFTLIWSTNKDSFCSILEKLTSISGWKDFVPKETCSLPLPFNFTGSYSISPWDRPPTNSATCNDSEGGIVQCKLQKDDAFPLCIKNVMKSFIWSTNTCFYNFLMVTSINNIKKDYK